MKYKRCCKGRIDWAKLAEESGTAYAKHLTLRGKNLMFVGNMLGLLQIDALNRKLDFADLKRAFTPEVVRGIHLAIPEFWPDLGDYERCVSEQAENVTAIYTGTYEPEAIFRAVSRHALYSEKIYLVDPFMDPRGMRDQYSPVIHPEEHRVNTIKYSFLWLSLYPWIKAGIVSFIRPLHDFVPGLYHEIHELGEEKLEAHPELKRAVHEYAESAVHAMTATDKGMNEYFFLCQPDQFFRKMYDSMPEQRRPGTFDDLLAWINARRANHPYYVDRLPGQRAEFLQQTSGAS